MFFSLLQTLVCVLLVNSGLYALHLTGSNTPGSNGLSSNNGQPHASSQLNKPSTNNFQATSNRLNEELADLAQLERERLMVMGLVKQTAEESGYHGRPIITGRIKMHPAEDIDSEYSAWLNQQARNVMFGNVVKQPLNDDADYDTGDAGFEPLKSSNKYDYGRPVQAVEGEFESPHNLDLDDFTELEPVHDEEDIFPDMDGYAYIEELMDEENKERLQQQHQYQPQYHQQQILQFPGSRQHAANVQQQQHHLPYAHSYQNHDPLDLNQKALESFLEKEQKLQILNHQQHQKQLQEQLQQQLQQQQQQQQMQQQLQEQQQQANAFNAKYRNNIRMQQKWLRKRNQMHQQQQQLPRNIFGQKNAKQQQPKPQHHFNSLSSNKLAVANSEATATTRSHSNKQTETAQHIQTQEQQQQKPKQQQQPLNDEADKQKVSSSFSSSSSSSTATKSDKSSNIQEQKPELLQQPNHKRSGFTPASLASTAGASSPHSLASQLMLRTARGQRQYDVPQIECPTAMDGMERFACPTPDVQGRYRCIDDHVLCDGFIDCPEGEDEDRRSCMFYKTTKAHLDVLADALLRWARGR